jgi:serine/threonine protein phosphatase 1
MIYIISDIHGKMDKFSRMLDLIQFGDTDFLYILGDVVDRGEEPVELVRFIMKQKNMELLLGNHEEMLLNTICRNFGESLWMMNGGYITMRQLDKLNVSDKNSVLDYISNRPLYKIIDNYILVHSGIYVFDKFNSIEDLMANQDKRTLLWSREDFYMFPSLKGYTIVFGHTPTYYPYLECDGVEKDPIEIWYDKRYKDKIGIDCCAYAENGRLACLRLDDGCEFYV